MTGADILTKPWEVNQRAECVYAYAPGEVCVDLTSGKPENRARVLALLGQAQAAFSLLGDVAREWCARYREPTACGECQPCRARTVLRDAGVMSEARQPPALGCAELCDFEPCRKAGECAG